MNQELLSDVNKRICDRTDCFYWQTDRKITVEEQAEIWKDRHSAISNDELLEKINSRNTDIKLAYTELFDENAQTSQGNVNSARVGVLENGQEVVIRCHPKGLRYVISKMALRVKRYSYDKSEFLSKLIDNGKKHLAELIEYFDLSDEKSIEEK